MTRQKVYEVIDSERAYQDNKYGGVSNALKNTLGDWIFHMQRHLDDARKADNISFVNHQEVLEELKKVVALGVACLEINGVVGRVSIKE